MTGLSWYWQRLVRMSVPEIGYRAQQAVRKRIDKHFAHEDSTKGTSGIPLRVPTVLRDELAETCRGFKDEVLKRADDAAAHRFEVFGEPHQYGPEINWHWDPKSGNEWPGKYWGDIDYRDGTTIGGIKFAWEVNRLQHLPQLALGYAVSGNEELRKELFLQIEHWMRSNPYPVGINWISGIELGIRIVNVFYAVRFLGATLLEENEQALVVRFITSHAQHLQRYPSKYSSCANHALAEALGLFVAGMACPDHRQASSWRDFGCDVLEREVTRQIYPDGSSFEHSIPYLPFVVDHFLVYRLVCQLYEIPYGSAIDERLESAIGFLHAVSDCKGHYPLVGDDDDGYLLRLDFDFHTNALSLRCSGGALFSRPEWLQSPNGSDAKSMLLLGLSGSISPEESIGCDAPKTRTAARYFADAGLAVLRSKEQGCEVLFVGNSGPLGLAPLSGHGHADALSVWLSVNGAPVLVDPGTYVYHGGGQWRTYFRSTAAHNTVRVDGKDQADIIADFMFDTPYRVSGHIEEQEDGKIVWSGYHDGYQRLADRVTHRRDVVLAENGLCLEMLDIVEAHDEHQVESFFHFDPRCTVSVSGRKVSVTAHSAAVEMHLDDGWTGIELRRGQEHPMGGWFSSTFNRLQASTTLVLQATTRGTVSFRTRIEVRMRSEK